MLELVQGSPAWLAARCGLVTASRVADVVARTKTGYAASRANYMAQLVAERLTGNVAESFTNAAMQWGTEHEPVARNAYEFYRDTEVQLVGMVKHPNIPEAAASPDGLVGTDGLVEIKCPNTATHIDTLLGQSVPGNYQTQMQWQMACTGRQWCDFASFDPRLPESMRLFICRVPRDDERIAELESAVTEFLVELREKVHRLRARYEPETDDLPEAARLLMAG
jgi:putative phage-type endonuclease